MGKALLVGARHIGKELCNSWQLHADSCDPV